MSPVPQYVPPLLDNGAISILTCICQKEVKKKKTDSSTILFLFIYTSRNMSHSLILSFLSLGVFWGTLRFWLILPVRRKSIVSLHKGSHWPLPPRAGRPLVRLRAEWNSPTLFPAVLWSPTNGMAVTSTAPPSGAGPTIPLAYGALPVATRVGG